MKIALLSLWIASVYGEQLFHHNTMDTCAILRGHDNLFKRLNLVTENAPNRGFLVETCVCLSNVHIVAQNNPVAIAATELVGNVAVTAALQSFIRRAAPTWNCVYPDNAVPLTPTCRDSDPCPFTCSGGYMANGNQCVRQEPTKVQNDEDHEIAKRFYATDAPKISPIAPPPPVSPPPKRRNLMGILAQDNCQVGFSLCGNPLAKTGEESWECLDTMSTLDSCGGCLTPYIHDLTPSTAVDCTALPGVVGVRCVQGKCLVSHCKRGWTRARNGQECIPI